jgi:4-amino-4-deoxy-L-arabinose transferase-like glycosyltransferase
LVESHTFPVLRISDKEGYEAHQPPLYYILGVPFYLLGKVVRMKNPCEMVRLLSLIVGAISIIVTYFAVLSAFPRRNGTAIGASGFAALLPTHVMLTSSVSNDSLMELMFGIGLLTLAKIVADGPRLYRTILLGLILGAGILTKTTCILLYPLAVVAYWLSERRAKTGLKCVLYHIEIAFGISLLVGGWWLVRNQHIYGDPLAIHQFEKAFQHTSKPEFFLERGFSWFTYFVLVTIWTFESFWGVFGHMNVFMPTWLYMALGVISLAVAIGLIKTLKELWKLPTERIGIILYVLTVVLTVATFIQFNLNFFQAQGRYLYPALVPISTFWVLGIERLLPTAIRKHSNLFAIGIPSVVQIIALTTCIPIMPYYNLLKG